MLTPVELPGFGTVDLRTDPQNLGLVGAVDGLNVDLDVRGALRTRDGYTKFTPTPGTGRFKRLFASYESQSTGSRLFGYQPSTGKVVAYDPLNAGFPDTSAVVVSEPYQMVHYGGTGTVSAMYGGAGSAAGTLLKYVSGVGFSYPAAGYAGYLVGLSPADNRLVLAYTTEATDGPDRVRFSDAGAPETFSANNYVDLWPNDGSTIRGVYTYKNMVFVFKESRFAVFYGNSVDGSGNPVFNYRAVDTGVGMCGFAAGCVSPNGVYFLGEDGIYLTAGEQPVKVSDALDPIFLDRLPATYQGQALNRFEANRLASLEWHNGRLYVALPVGVTSTNNRLFVLDPAIGWLEWDVAAAGLVSWLTPSSKSSARLRDLFFSYSNTTNDIGILGAPSTTDDGTAITGRYRTGFWNPGQPGGESVVREWLIDGAGSVTVKTAVNDAATLGTGATVTLGSAPAIAQGRDRRAVRGRNVSVEFSGTGPWSVSRVIANLRSQRNPGMKAT